MFVAIVQTLCIGSLLALVPTVTAASPPGVEAPISSHGSSESVVRIGEAHQRSATFRIPQVGDCYIVSSARRQDRTVERVSCEQPHNSETYFVGKRNRDGSSANVCDTGKGLRAFYRYTFQNVDGPYSMPALYLMTWDPPRREQRAGARYVRCDVTFGTRSIRDISGNSRAPLGKPRFWIGSLDSVRGLGDRVGGGRWLAACLRDLPGGTFEDSDYWDLMSRAVPCAEYQRETGVPKRVSSGWVWLANGGLAGGSDLSRVQAREICSAIAARHVDEVERTTYRWQRWTDVDGTPRLSTYCFAPIELVEWRPGWLGVAPVASN